MHGISCNGLCPGVGVQLLARVSDAAQTARHRDVYGTGLPPRVALSLDLGYASADTDVRAEVKAAADALAKEGIEVETCHLAVAADSLDTILKPIALTEQAAAAAGPAPKISRNRTKNIAT